MITTHSNMKEKYTGTHFGVLALRGFKPSRHGKEDFSQYAAGEFQKIRHKHLNYNRKQFCTDDPIVFAYTKHFKRFKKSYPVMLQMESVLNGKEPPDVSLLIQALFLTEMQTTMLISGHDLAKASPPFSIECAEGGETYIAAGEREIALKSGDISLRDQNGFILSTIYGQDERTRVTGVTSEILYFVDGVPGLDKGCFTEALETLLHNVRIFQPNIQPELMDILHV